MTQMLTPSFAQRTELAKDPDSAKKQLDEQVRAIIKWHFSDDTGSPYWLKFKREAGFDPVKTVDCFDALIDRFPHFKDEELRDQQPEVWVPQPFKNRPFNIFETGGTTGMPQQRIGWEDYKVDYEEFSDRYGDDIFPKGKAWLMVGPTGPRRLRLAIEHIANYRGGPCYFVDLDPRFVKRVLSQGLVDVARDYQKHVVEQAATILKNRKISSLFTTPKLLESLSEIVSIPDVGIKGVFCGGTSMTPQNVRFLCEEVLEGRTKFIPTYGNTLMGLACSDPNFAKQNYSITYYSPQPRAVLRAVDPKDTKRVVGYGEWGRVELTTLTREFFVPRFLERDEVIRREPIEGFPWDGVGDVRPFGATEKKIIEGVY